MTKLGRPILALNSVVKNSQCPQCHHCRSLSSSSVPYKQREHILIRRSRLPVYDYGTPQTSKKRFYVFGSSVNGELGAPDLLRREIPREFMHRPVRHRFGGVYDVKDVAVGHGFTLISVKHRTKDSPLLFGTGLNTSSQLGYQEARRNAPLQTLISLAPVPLPTPGHNLWNIISIGAGRAHSLVSVHGEGLITFGDNSSGQCGRIPIQDEVYFPSKLYHKIPLSYFGGENVKQIITKFDVTFCLTESGKVYSFGLNEQCQLGRGRNILKHWEPALVTGDISHENIIKLDTSGSSVLAVSENGDLFAWGSNTSGEVNPELYGQNLAEPRMVKLDPKIGKIVDCAVGDMHSFIVNDAGNVYTWGRGRYLGLGPSTQMVKKPTIIPPPLFGRNEFSSEVRVQKIYSTFHYSGAINSEGSLFMWGKNENGCLGLGLRPKLHYEQFFPLRVSLVGFVEKVGLGIDHTVVLCRGGL